MDVRLQWSIDFAALLERCEKADKGHLRGILHRWHSAATNAHLYSPALLTALVVYGEARGENDPGPRAVFEVIANRAMRITPSDLDVVLLRRLQFSCLNSGDPSLDNAESFAFAGITFWLKRMQTFIAQYDKGARLLDLENATMYGTPQVCGEMYTRWLCGDKHAWEFKQMVFCRTIGNHSFYREV